MATKDPPAWLQLTSPDLCSQINRAPLQSRETSRPYRRLVSLDFQTDCRRYLGSNDELHQFISNRERHFDCSAAGIC